MYRPYPIEPTEENIKKALCENLIIHREGRHMTQVDLAVETGLHQSVIARIENGQANPTLKTLLKISEALGGWITFTPTLL